MAGIHVDSSPKRHNVDYCEQIASIPTCLPTGTIPSNKEIDLLAYPFQQYANTIMPRWSGSNYSINPLPINAELIGGPKITAAQKRYSNSVARIGGFTTGGTSEIARFPPRTVLNIDSGFEFQIFRSTCPSTKVDHVIAAFLPRYHGGIGIDTTVYMDYEVSHNSDAWGPFMNAIKCNLAKNLPTVLLLDNEAWMLLENGRHNPPTDFEFIGYKLDDISSPTRPTLSPLTFTNAFHCVNYEQKYPRPAMAFVAFQPL